MSQILYKSKLPQQYQNIADVVLESEKHKLLPSGILLYGPGETAKNSIASKISSAILSKTSDKPHPDELILKPDQDDSKISIEAVRHFITFFSSSPLVAIRRVGIIFSADLLTVQSQNALLKTLEEPAKQSCMILVVDNYTKILETVKSRLAKIFVPILPQKEYNTFLNSENKKLNPELLTFCVGRPERTKRLQIEEEELALFSKKLYEDIKLDKTLIFKYTAKKTKSDPFEIEQCVPYLIMTAHEDLLKNPQNHFANRFLTRLLDYSKNSLNRNLTLILENVCVQP